MNKGLVEILRKQELRAQYKDLAVALECSEQNIKQFKKTSPRKLELMLKGLRFERLLMELERYELVKRIE
jgi:hypothetical protein